MFAVVLNTWKILSRYRFCLCFRDGLFEKELWNILLESYKERRYPYDMKKAKKSIVGRIEEKPSQLYGHVKRMDNTRWSEKIFEWIPLGKWKGGRHCRRWTDDIQESMEAKQLQKNLWRNRREWQRGYEKQRQVIEHSLYILL